MFFVRFEVSTAVTMMIIISQKMIIFMFFIFHFMFLKITTSMTTNLNKICFRIGLRKLGKVTHWDAQCLNLIQIWELKILQQWASRYGLLGCQCLAGTCYLHLQGRRWGSKFFQNVGMHLSLDLRLSLSHFFSLSEHLPLLPSKLVQMVQLLAFI
jgi:hypothetical protein